MLVQVRLDLFQNELDIDAFDTGAREALSRATDGSSAQPVQVADATLSLWRGDPYLELPDHQDAVVETARLSELRRTLRQVRAEGLLSPGRTEEAVAELEQLVLEYQLHEQLWEHLMLGRIQLGHHGTALQAYHRARGELADLGLDPGPTLRRLQTTALRHQDESRRPPCGLPTSLTRFLGREPELEELESSLGRHRLVVTVTGVGGVGKTRTAVEAARRQRNRFPGGTWFVPLAEVGQGEHVEHAVAGVLGLRTNGDLTTALRHHLVGGPVLLVLAVPACGREVETARREATVVRARARTSVPVGSGRRPRACSPPSAGLRTAPVPRWEGPVRWHGHGRLMRRTVGSAPRMPLRSQVSPRLSTATALGVSSPG